MSTVTKKNQGKGAPSTAPKKTKVEEKVQEDLEKKTKEDEKIEEDVEKEETDNKSGAEEETEEQIEDQTEEQAEDETEEASKDPEENGEKDDKEGDDKIKFSGAARKRFRFFLNMGYSKEEAREKALNPVQSGTKRAGSPDSRGAKKPKGEKGVKLCVVHEKFPEELLTTEQLKTVQESIMDQILEMGGASSTKPKFHSSTHREGWLAIICADKVTADWLKTVTPTLHPWEEASLKALEDDEMPHPETFVGFFPDSKDYSEEKILKLLEAQNDSFNVSTWKVLKKGSVDEEAEVTFSIDRKFAIDLKKAGHRVNYKFGHVRLFPKDNNKKGTDDNKDSKPKAKPSPRGSFRGKGPRSDWKGGSKRSGSEWRGGRGASRSSYKGRRGGGDPRAGGSPWVWSKDSDRGPNRGQGPNMWYGDSWKPWKM